MKHIEILYEDNHYIAVNKPTGIPVQADISGDACLLDEMKNFLKKEYKKEGNVFLGLIHRVDRPVSGLVIFAKTSKGLSRMNELFKNRTVKKTYWALTKNKLELEEGSLIHYLVKNEEKNKTKALEKEGKNSKLSHLNYKLIAHIGEKFLYEIDLKSGRHHQIRAQLAKVGSPIIGDYKYGYTRGIKDRSICLHSRKLEFIHPIKNEPVEITASLPLSNVFWQDFLNLS